MTQSSSKRTEWFKAARWGVFCHYLAAPASSAGGKEVSAEEWNRHVDSFDTNRLAAQLESVGAKYFAITIGQNSGHYCSPNATYEAIAQIRPSKLSKRDLIQDLHQALAPKNIRLMVYLPSGAPAAEPEAMKKFEWEWGFEGGWGNGGWDSKRTGKRLREFQLKWEAVVREWSLHWGGKVSGWFIDGCYFSDEMYRHPEPPNFESFASAMRAGSPNSLIAFNPGNFLPIKPLSPAEDFTFGELDGGLFLGYWGKSGFQSADGMVDGVLLHAFTFLGDWWGQGNPRLPDELVVGYTKYLNGKGGVMTWDVPISYDGKIPEPFIDQLRKLNATLGK